MYKGFSTDIKLSELKMESAIDYSSSEKCYSRKGGENFRAAVTVLNLKKIYDLSMCVEDPCHTVHQVTLLVTIVYKNILSTRIGMIVDW